MMVPEFKLEPYTHVKSYVDRWADNGERVVQQSVGWRGFQTRPRSVASTAQRTNCCCPLLLNWLQDEGAPRLRGMMLRCGWWMGVGCLRLGSS